MIKSLKKINVQWKWVWLKKEEQYKIETNRDFKRWLTKVNYLFMTDSIKSNLIPKDIRISKISHIYAEEADLVNVALFNMTAQERKNQNKQKAKEWYNMRDFATPEQLVVLTNLEFKNSELIKEWLPQEERLIRTKIEKPSFGEVFFCSEISTRVDR